MDQVPGAAGPDPWAGLMAPDRIRLRRLQAGEALFRQGDPAAALFRLDSGRVRLLRCLEDGTSVVLHVARPGETFAEASTFAEAYHCDAVADVASVVAAIPKADALAALAGDGAARLGFTRLLAAQVRDLRTRAELRSIRPAQGRLLAWLRLRASGNPPGLCLDRSWTEVAAELGLTREAVYRALAALERSGRIARQATRVTLTCGR